MSEIFIGYGESDCSLTNKKKGLSSGEDHLFLCALPRSGKGRDLFIQAALQYTDGSMIIIDPKGQLAAVTVRQRKKFERLFVLNPFDLLPAILGPPARCKSMDALDPESESFESDCDVLADGIICVLGSISTRIGILHFWRNWGRGRTEYYLAGFAGVAAISSRCLAPVCGYIYRS